MKKLKFLEIFIATLLIELFVICIAFYVLFYYKVILTAHPPFYAFFDKSGPILLHNYHFIKHNAQAITCILLFVLLVDLFLYSLIKPKILIYRLSSILLVSPLFYILTYLIYPVWAGTRWGFLSALALAYLPAVVGYGRFIKDFGIKNKVIRGALKFDDKKAEAELIKLAKKESRGENEIKIWKNLELPFKRESEHLLIIGSTGAGKTQIIYPILSQVIERGDKVIIWDVKGTYTQAILGKEGVELLAPWDSRSIQWDIGKDVRNTAECLGISQTILPENLKDPQPYFLNSARQVLEASILNFVAKEEEWGWGDLWSFLTQGRKKLSDRLKHTPEGRSARIAIEASNRSSQDVYSTMITACKSIRWFAKAWPKGGVSLREWVKSSGGRVLILGGVPERAELAAMTANLAINVLVNEILSLPDDLNRRIWLVLDEFGTLPKNDQFINAFTVGRSKGLCTIMGIQDIGRIQYAYGRELCKTIINSFNTSIFLRCTDPETSQWVSQFLGEQELREHQSTTESLSKQDQKDKKHESKTESLHKKLLFLPSEIADMEAMTGVLKISGWPVAKLKWSLTKIPNNNSVVQNAEWINEKPVFEEYVIEEDVNIDEIDGSSGWGKT